MDNLYEFNMKKDSLITGSLLCSVMLHVIFIGASYYLEVPSGRYQETPLDKMFNVKTVLRDAVSPAKSRPELSYIEKRRIHIRSTNLKYCLSPRRSIS